MADPKPEDEIGTMSINQRLVAIEIIRQVLLLRYSLRLRMELVRALNDTEHPIASLLRDQLNTEAGMRDPTQVRQLDALIDRVNAMRAPAWAVGQAAVENQLVEFTAAEVEDEHSALNALAPSLALVLPVAGMVGAQALATPFQGRTVRQWTADAQEAEAKRIRQAIILGLSAGEDAATIARRVVGSASLKGSDGATQTSRNHVDTIIRSALVNAATVGRQAVYTVNQLTTEQFVAVLDDRTTQVCRSLNGNRYKLGEGPQPPIHMNCRSMRVIVLPENIGGPVWEPEVYAAWLNRQPWSVKVELLGASRAAKARRSPVDPGPFTDYGAKPMTLNQIRTLAKRLTSAYYN